MHKNFSFSPLPLYSDRNSQAHNLRNYWQPFRIRKGEFAWEWSQSEEKLKEKNLVTLFELLDLSCAGHIELLDLPSTPMLTNQNFSEPQCPEILLGFHYLGMIVWIVGLAQSPAMLEMFPQALPPFRCLCLCVSSLSYHPLSSRSQSMLHSHSSGLTLSASLLWLSPRGLAYSGTAGIEFLWAYLTCKL